MYGTYIPTLVELLQPYGARTQYWGSWALWANYWWWQSLVGCGLWTLAHEAGHSTLSPKMWVNHAIGYTLHCLVLVPYYGWRYSHNMHRTSYFYILFWQLLLTLIYQTDRLVSRADKATNSIERDENFVPATRSDWKLPAPEQAEPSKYAEILEEAPIVSLFRLFIQQALGLEAYLMVNAGGNPMYPAGTNVS